MNAMERMKARLKGEPVDQPPNHCIIMGFGARQLGVSYRDFVNDYKILTEAGIRCAESFGIDILSAISDPMREAEGFGAHVIYPEDGVPYAPEALITDLKELSVLTVRPPESCRRMNDRLLAVQRYQEYADGQYPVQGWVEGAFAEACDLHGLNEMLTDIVLEPEAAKELLEITLQQAIQFAVAQVQAGADIIGIGDAAGSLVGPALYEEFVLPYEIRLIKAIHQTGALVRLHICGNITPILELVACCGADIIDCDWMVDFARAAEVFHGRCSASGNFDPVEILLNGTPESVEDAVRHCLEVSANTSIIAAGCEVPPFTPPQNLYAVSQTLVRYGNGRL